MERDLHDGAQQRLVSLGMQLRLAQRHLDDGTVDVDELLDESVAELGTAVAELRQIAHGLRPSSLDDGLPAALSNLVRSLPMTVDMDVDDSPLPDAVATTAYYVASEAITNAVKHAEATRIGSGRRRDGQLLVRVTDDGCGGARLGLRSGLADRVAALGGSLRVASPAAAAPRWRRCCRAHRDRRGLGAVPRGAGPAARGRRPRGRGPGRRRRRRWSRRSSGSSPDLAIIDVRMPPDPTDDGARAARELRAGSRTWPSCCSPSTSRPGTRSSWSPSGRFGYLLKDRVFDVDDFMDALHRVAAGGSALDPEVVATLIGPRRDDDPLRSSPRGNARCSRSWPRAAPTPASPVGCC